MDPTAERQNQDLVNLPLRSCEETSEGAAAVHEEPPYDYGNEWNYFKKKKKPLRAICKDKDCEEVVKLSKKLHRWNFLSGLRSHLKKEHNITFSRPLPDNLKINYTELENSKAKCKHCGKRFCYFINDGKLYNHISTQKCIYIHQSEKPYNYGNEWDYFVKKGPLQAICRDKDCNEEVQSNSDLLKSLRSHLKKEHNITLNRPLPKKRRTHYTELENSKAKCKHCNKTFCYFLSDNTLRNHEETCIGIQNRPEPSTSNSKPSTSNSKPSTSSSKPSTSSSTGHVTDPTIKKYIPQSKKPSGLSVQLSKQKEEKAIKTHELSISISGNDEKSPSAKRQRQKSPGLPDESTEHIEDKAVAIYKRVESVLQQKKSLDSSIPILERTRIDTDAFDEPGTSSSMGYNTVAECQSKELPRLPVSPPLPRNKCISAIYTIVQSILESMVDEVCATVERQSQESSDLSAPSSEQTKSDGGALDDSVMSETETRTLPPFKEL